MREKLTWGEGKARFEDVWPQRDGDGRVTRTHQDKLTVRSPWSFSFRRKRAKKT